MQKIGSFSQAVIDVLELEIQAGTPIYIGESNEEHIKSRHPEEYELYYPKIGDIIANPDYVGKNQKNDSIDFVKLFELHGNYVQVSVRVTASGKSYVKTMFLLMTFKAERYIRNGTLKQI